MYFSQTFKALNFDFQIQGLSRTFKVRANPDNKLAKCNLKKYLFGEKNERKTGEFRYSMTITIRPLVA